MTYTNNSNYNDEWIIVDRKDYTLMFMGYEAGDPLMPPILNSVSTSLHNNANMDGYEYTLLSKNDLLIYLSSSSIFSCITHGEQTSIYTSDGKLTVSDINGLSSNAFDNLEFVYLGACLTGEGKDSANNLVNAIYNKGADTVLGFIDEIFVIEANLWTEVFMTTLSTGCTVNTAINAADAAVWEDNDCQSLPFFTMDNAHRYLVGSGALAPCA